MVWYRAKVVSYDESNDVVELEFQQGQMYEYKVEITPVFKLRDQPQKNRRPENTFLCQIFARFF